jgi:replication factor C subunit 3/5
MESKLESNIKSNTGEDPTKYDDSLPYVERFRPKVLDDVLSHKSIITTLKTYLHTRRIPHLLFYGPPGTGKTSTIESFLNELYGEINHRYMVMNINASEERGIDVVRGKIKNFVNSKAICGGDSNTPVFKFVILDEADAITVEAQNMLRIVIESNTKYARFCLICNCIKKVNPAIQSRCKNFKFSPLDDLSVRQKIKSVSKINGTTVTDSGTDMIWKLSKGDMRTVLHYLQVISMSYRIIDADIVSNFVKYPSLIFIDRVYNSLMHHKLDAMIKTIRDNKIDKFYSLKDIMAEISDRVCQDIDNGTISLYQAIYINKQLRDIEMNMITTSETDQQLTSIAAAFVIMKNMDDRG